MSVAKVIEINASSKKNFEDAVENGISKASKTINNITGAWVNEEKVVVEDGEIKEWRVNMKVSFLID